MGTALVSGWAGSIAFYELAVFDPSDSVLNPIWRQGIFVLPFMTRIGVTKSRGGWTVQGKSFWVYEGGPSYGVEEGRVVIRGVRRLPLAFPEYSARGISVKGPGIWSYEGVAASHIVLS